MLSCVDGSDGAVVLEAVAQNAKAFLLAPEELRTDRDFVLAVVEKNFLALEYAPEDLRAELAELVQLEWELKCSLGL